MPVAAAGIERVHYQGTQVRRGGRQSHRCGTVVAGEPDPNRSGAAYLEDFDSDQAIPVSLRETNWRFASAPQTADGLDPSLGIAEFNPDDAVQMTWQNLVPGPDGRTVQLRPQDIDSTIVLAGTGDQFETVLWTTFHADTAGGFVRDDRSSASARHIGSLAVLTCTSIRACEM